MKDNERNINMKRKEISSVLLDNGNILFSYRPYTLKETWILASFPCLVSLVLLIIEWLNSKTCYSITLFILSIPLFLFLWLNIRDRRNKKIEESLINFHLQDIIEADIKRINNNILEIERLYEIEAVNDSTTYGKRRMVVTLNNGKQLIYSVDNPRMLTNILLLEISTKPITE